MSDQIKMKAVLNKEYGGFHLSDEAMITLIDMGVELKYDYGDCGLERNDPRLIQVVEKLGDKASNGSSKLRVVEVVVFIRNYDGVEQIEENRVYERDLW